MAGFNDILGNYRIKSSIKNAVITGSVNHAYIISGIKGSGKKTIAGSFAAALQCEGEDSPCGRCQSCRMAESGNNPDIIFPKPVKTKNIGVTDIREQVISAAAVKPYMFKYKIFIIDEADKMTVEAQNAFLKTLEEPPSYAVFMLLAESTDSFLPTILSRCALLRTESIDSASISGFLTARGVEPEKASVAAEYSRGSIGEAIELAENEDFTAMRDDIISLLSGIYDKDSTDVMLLGEYFNNTYKNDDRVTDIASLWFRDLLAAKVTGDEKYIIQKDKIDMIFNAAERETAESIIKKAQAVKKTAVEIRMNANFRLAMEVMLMNIKEN